MIYSYSRSTSKSGRHFPWLLLLAGLLAFCVFLTFYSTFLTGEQFQDELDVFVVGSEVAYGAGMYKTTVSQHMPFSYYLAALITWVVHPHNAHMYRFCFYVLLSLLWTAIFLRYRKQINPFALLLTPLVYTTVLRLYFNGTTMLSEHWAGIGHVILLLELLCYLKTKRLKLSSCIWISASILLSFGCVFSSAYSIAVVALGVFVYQLWLFTFGTPIGQRAEMRRQILKDDACLLLCVLLPWAMLLGWYAANGNIENFIYSVYTFNVEVYSQWTGGLGTDPLGTFLNCIPRYMELLVENTRYLMAGDFSLETIASVLYTVCPILVGLAVCFKQPIIGVTYFLATTCITVRGFNNYHALHFICAACLSICLLTGAGVRLPFRHWKNPLSYIGCAAGVFILYLILSSMVTPLRRVWTNFQKVDLLYHDTDTKEFTDIVTDPGDKIHYTDFYTTPIDVERPIDYGPASSTPWTWIGFGEKEVQTLSENQTKIVFYADDPGASADSRDDYASELVDVLKQDYYSLGGSIYIRRSYLNEAVRRMIQAKDESYLEFYDATPLSASEKASSVSLREAEQKGQTVGISFTPTEDILLELIEFWPEKHISLPFADLKVTISDAETGEIAGEQTTAGAYLQEGEMNLFFSDSLVLSEGTTYNIVFTLVGDGDVYLMTAGAIENEFGAAALPGVLSGNETVRIAVETSDPSYAAGYGEDDEDDYDDEYEDEYDDYGDEEDEDGEYL